MQEQGLVIALVGVLGIGAQWVAWRTGWPAIVLMLIAGFLAGPILGVIDPHHAFGELLEPMISIGVAIILFEGGLSLDFRELRKTGGAVWRLVVFGVPIAWVAGSLACYYIAGLVWPVSILFAGILVVTGPTVVLPLLRLVRGASAGLLARVGLLFQLACCCRTALLKRCQLLLLALALALHRRQLLLQVPAGTAAAI